MRGWSLIHIACNGIDQKNNDSLNQHPLLGLKSAWLSFLLTKKPFKKAMTKSGITKDVLTIRIDHKK